MPGVVWWFGSHLHQAHAHCCARAPGDNCCASTRQADSNTHSWARNNLDSDTEAHFYAAADFYFDSKVNVHASAHLYSNKGAHRHTPANLYPNAHVYTHAPPTYTDAHADFCAGSRG